MAGEPLREELGLDIQPALDALEPLGVALDTIASNFATAVSDALASIDASQVQIPADQIVNPEDVTAQIDQAIADVVAPPVPVDVTADASDIDVQIADALDAPRPPVDIEGDTSALSAEIADATSVGATIAVDADITAAKDAIDALDNEPITVSADADVSAAQDSIDQLGASATAATGHSGGDGVAGLEGAVLGFKAASGAAIGETSALEAGVGGLGSGFAGAAAGVAAFGVFIGETTKLAADAEAQNKRFAATFGNLADAVEHIHVGGLNTTLADLAKQSGTTIADMEATASRIGLLGKSAGAAAPQIVKTTQNLLALGATFSVNNPRLGDAASVTDRLTNAFARGGRALAPFGIALSAAQINLEAMNETGKTSAADLTLFEKSTAGANLALKVYGNTLGTTFKEGAQNAEVQMRALKVELEETLVAIGKPLLGPVVQSLQEFLPVAQQTGVALGNLAQAVLPLVTDLAPALAPVGIALSGVSSEAKDLGDVVGAIPGPVVLAGAALTALGLAAAGAADGLIAAGIALAANPITAAALGLALGIKIVASALRSGDDASKSIAVDTSALAGVFDNTGSAAGGFAGSLLRVADATNTYLQAALKVDEHGQTGFEAFAKIGLTVDQAKAAIAGTSAEYDRFSNAIISNSAVQKLGLDTSVDLSNVIGEGRIQLVDSTKAVLAQEVATGVLSKAQLDASVAAHKNNAETALSTGEVTDYIAVAKDLAPAIDASTNAHNANAIAVAAASPAYQQLVQDLGAGKISVDTFAGSLDQFNFSAEQSTAFAQSLSSEMQSFSTALTGNLPTARTALDDYTSQVKTDFQAIVTAEQGGKTASHDLFAQLIADSDPSKFSANLQQQAQNIEDFATNIQKVANVAPQLAAFLAQQGPTVAGGLTKLLAGDPVKAKIAEGSANLLAFAQQGISAIGDRVNATAQASGANVGQNLMAGIQTNFHPQFSGPVTDAMAAAAEALQRDQSVSQAAGQKALDALKFFGDHLTINQAVRTALELAHGTFVASDIPGAAKGLGERATAAFTPSWTTQARTALAGAHDTIQGDGTVAGKAKEKGDQTGKAFKPPFSESTSAQLTVAAQVLQKTGQMTIAAGTAGKAVGVGFDSGLAQGLTDPGSLATITTAANTAAAAIPLAMRKILGIASPSKVGIALGEQFTQGVALGVADTGPINPAVTALSSGLLDQLEAQLQAGFARAAGRAQANAAVAQFVSSAISSLPNVNTQISAFSQGVSSAASTQASAFATLHAAQATYRHDQLEVIRLSNEVAFAFAFAAGTTGAAQQAAITQAEQFQSQLDSARGKVTGDLTALNDARRANTKANQELAAASDPSVFIRNLHQQTEAGQRFFRDLQKLTKEGFGALAENLAAQGPEAAGKLADALAGNRAKARAANAAVKQAATFATTFASEVSHLFGVSPAIAAAGQAGTNAGNAFSDGFSSALVVGGVDLTKVLPNVAIVGAPALAAASPTFIPAPVVGPSGGTQTLNLDLTVVLADGSTVHAVTDVPLNPRTTNLSQQVKAEVHAS